MNKQEKNSLKQAQEQYLASIATELHGQQLLDEFALYMKESNSPLPDDLERQPTTTPLEMPHRGRSRRQSLLQMRKAIAIPILALVLLLAVGFTFSIVQLLTTREGEEFADYMATMELPPDVPYTLIVPQGYVLEYYGQHGQVREMIFSDSSGNNIFLFLFPLNYTTSADTDVLERRTVWLDSEVTAELSTTSDGYRLLWTWDNQLFVLKGDIPPEQIIALASSVKKK